MIPTLLVHDHIFVNKTSFGLRVPFVPTHLLQWASPRRGDVVVFRYPKNPEIFYIKRVVALGGDELQMVRGQLVVNGIQVPQQKTSKSWDSGQNDEDDFDHYLEEGHPVRYRKGERELAELEPTQVPHGSFFAMGDNRDRSDSRVWGFVPESHLVGRPTWIWLSCNKTLPTAQFLCDPQSMRWSRFFNEVVSSASSLENSTENKRQESRQE